MPKCKDCGLLAHRHRDTRELLEVGKLYRDTRTFSPPDDYKKYTGDPRCVGMVENFSGNAETLRTKLETDRACSRFIQWQMGFSPKEHMEMSFLQQQEERHNRWDAEDRKWRQEQSDRDHAWRERQAVKAEKWRRRQVKATAKSRQRQAQRDRRRHVTDLVVMGLLVTLVSVFGQILAAFIERGSAFPDRVVIQPMSLENAVPNLP